MTEEELLERLSLADRLWIAAVDLAMTGAPRALVAAAWLVIEKIERRLVTCLPDQRWALKWHPGNESRDSLPQALALGRRNKSQQYFSYLVSERFHDPSLLWCYPRHAPVSQV